MEIFDKEIEFVDKLKALCEEYYPGKGTEILWGAVIGTCMEAGMTDGDIVYKCKELVVHIREHFDELKCMANVMIKERERKHH